MHFLWKNNPSIMIEGNYGQDNKGAPPLPLVLGYFIADFPRNTWPKLLFCNAENLQWNFLKALIDPKKVEDMTPYKGMIWISRIYSFSLDSDVIKGSLSHNTAWSECKNFNWRKKNSNDSHNLASEVKGPSPPVQYFYLITSLKQIFLKRQRIYFECCFETNI